MENLFLSSGDISSLPSLSYKTSSVIVGTATAMSDIMLRTNNTNAFYINSTQQIYINTSNNRGRVNIGNAGDHIVCYYNNDNTKYSTISVDSTGSLRLNTVGSIYFDTDIYLKGTRVDATAIELNYNNGVTPGTASANKTLILNGSKSITGINSISATALTGTLQTAIQPNITSIGTLDSLVVTNGVTASTLTGTLQTTIQSNITQLGTLSNLNVTNGIVATAITGTLQTAAQPNITSVGTLDSLVVTNGVTASLLTGTIQTATQPNITSVGTLGSLVVTNGVTASSLTGTLQTASQPNITAVGTLGSLSVVNGINASSISASSLTGTIQTASQPNITGVGTLGSLVVTNGVTASSLTGTIQTASQPNITSVGTLGSLVVTNGVSASSVTASSLTGPLQTASQPNITSVGTLGSLVVTNGVSASSVTASSLTGTLQTASQPNITSVGTLGSLVVTNGVTASSLMGTLQTASQPNITSVGTLGSLVVTNGVTASSLTGTLQTASQPNITSVGTLGSLSVSGITTLTNTNDAVGVSTGAVVISGGVGIAKKLYVGTGINGVLDTVSQPNITSVGTLTSLNVSGDITSDQTITAQNVVSQTAIATTSGGTGFNTYTKGDLLAGNASNTLMKLPASSNPNNILVANSSTSTGLAWDYGFILENYSVISYINTTSATSYLIGSYYGRDSTNQSIVKVATAKSINLSTFGLNGIASSSNLSGTIFPAVLATSITGTGTSFVTDISSPHTVITLGGERRKVTSIVSNTSIQIDSPFTLLNSWALGATGTIGTPAKFGTNAFNGANATTSFATMTIGSRYTNYTSTAAKLWTLEFWIRTTVNSAQCIMASSAAFTFLLSLANTGIMSLSLGQGTTFNIANASAITGAVVAATYYHMAIVFTGTSYIVYRNGAVVLTVNSALPLTQTCFNTFRFGSNGTTAFNGQIDEARLSNSVRYTGAFTAPTTAFTYDSSTLALNHFDNTGSVTASDDATTNISDNQFTYSIDGGVYANTVYYGYAIADTSNTNTGYVFSSSFTQPSLPVGYTLFKQIPFYVITNPGGSLIASRYVGGRTSNESFVQLMTPILLIGTSVNATPTILNTSLFPYVPQNTTSLVLLIRHVHLTTTNASVIIGHNASGLVSDVLPTPTASTIQMQYTLPINTMSIDSYLSVAGTGSSYSVLLCGFYT